MGCKPMLYFKRDSKMYGCFSNFYACVVVYKGELYLNSEAAWQAQKCPSRSREFINLNGSNAKRLGRQVSLRKDWEEIKYSEMVEVLTCKFSQNRDLLNILLSTGNEVIVEDTTGWHDNLWGQCSCEKCKGIKGQNLLGKALMEVREKLRAT